MKSIDTTPFEKRSHARHLIQSFAWALVVITIVGGLRYPLLGFMVPVVMITGLVGSFFRGRFVCGWLCPRGAFFDKVISRISPKKPIPRLLKDRGFRWMVFVVLMGFMILQKHN